jgi:P-type Cu2+ transporter
VSLAVAGLMNPLFAAVLMPLSSLATLAIVGVGMRRVFKQPAAQG